MRIETRAIAARMTACAVALRRSCLGVTLAGLASIAFAAPRTMDTTTRLYGAPDQPNISGLWEADRDAPNPDSQSAGARKAPEGPPTWGSTPAPLNAEYAAKYKAIIAAAEAGHPIADTLSQCQAIGVPYLELGPGTTEVIQTPGQITMIQQSGHEVRRIFTDGRAADPDADPWFDGHSVAHWEGKTLVVEVSGLRPETPLDGTDTPHSDALHIVERWTLVSPGRLRIDAVATDPKAFTQPWTATHWWSRSPADTQMSEEVCEDNNRNLTNSDGTQGITLHR